MGRRKTTKDVVAEERRAHLPKGTVNVKFKRASFRHEGVEYKSAQVEKLAEAGDEKALLIIAQLVEMQSGVIEIVKDQES